MLVVLEGTDGVGKTTTSHRLKLLLEKEKPGMRVAVLAYPCLEGTYTGGFLEASLQGGSYVSSQFRKYSSFLEKLKSTISEKVFGSLGLSLNKHEKAWEDMVSSIFRHVLEGNNMERSLLFALNRYETKGHLGNLMEANDLVILDRYIGSNLAYNYGERDFLFTLELDVLKMPTPDLNILLDTHEPMKLSGGDVYESRESVQVEIIQSYKDLAAGKAFPEWNWGVVNIHDESGQRKTEDVVAKEVFNFLDSWLGV